MLVLGPQPVVHRRAGNTAAQSKSCGDHRIIESLRLEKTSKITKSNHQPNTTMPAKPCLKVPC